MSLREKIGQILEKESPQVAENWLKHYPSGNYPFEMEVVYVNNYLRHQLGQLPVDTIEERECLVDNITERDWLRHFERSVAMTIVVHGLPDWR